MAGPRRSRRHLDTMLAAGALLVSAAPAAGLAAGTAEMVVQWRYEGTAPAELAWRLVAGADAIRGRCGNLCIVEGHEVGGGAANIFLYVDEGNVDAMLALLVKLLDGGALAPGMQVGVAETGNAGPAAKVYRPAFPAGLDGFRLTYATGGSGL